MKAMPTLSPHTIAASCLALIALIVTGPAQAQSTGSQGTWSAKAPLPTQRTEVAVVELDGKIYALGGAAGGNSASQLNQEYDPATDRWRDRAPIPRGLSHAGTVGFSGKIYVVGGFTAAGVHSGAVNLVFAYDVATDSWRQLASLSNPRGSVGVAAVAGKIHAIGGRGLDKVTVATHEVYDPSTGQWQQAAALPTARDHMGVIVVDGKIHVIGGRTGSTSDNTRLHDVYDPATNSWQSAASLPTARSAGAAAYYHGLILYAGGECRDGKTFFENEGYDPTTNRWLTLAPLPAGRHAFGAATAGQYAYFVGGALGCGGGSPSDQLLAFRLPWRHAVAFNFVAIEELQDMPLFDFRCRACGSEFELLVRASDVPRCPSCKGTRLEQLPSVFAVSSVEITKARVRTAKKERLRGRAYRD